MPVSLESRLNLKQWTNAIAICQKALNRGYLNDYEATFVKDMIEEFAMNGTMMEPTVKQFNQLKMIAYEFEGSV